MAETENEIFSDEHFKATPSVWGSMRFMGLTWRFKGLGTRMKLYSHLTTISGDVGPLRRLILGIEVQVQLGYEYLEPPSGM